MRVLSITILLAACATTSTVSTPKDRPRGLRASEHLAAAAQHDQQARERSTWPDTRMTQPGGFDPAGPPVAMPWFRSWDTAGEHEQLAAIHRSEAEAQHAAYEQACGDRPPRRAHDLADHSPWHRRGADDERGGHQTVTRGRPPP